MFLHLTIPNLQTKAAQERLEEMRALIGRRQVESAAPRTRPRSGTLDGLSSRPTATSDVTNLIKTIEVLASEADTDLASAQSRQETLQAELAKLANEFKEV